MLPKYLGTTMRALRLRVLGLNSPEARGAALAAVEVARPDCTLCRIPTPSEIRLPYKSNGC